MRRWGYKMKDLHRIWSQASKNVCTSLIPPLFFLDPCDVSYDQSNYSSLRAMTPFMSQFSPMFRSCSSSELCLNYYLHIHGCLVFLRAQVNINSTLVLLRNSTPLKLFQKVFFNDHTYDIYTRTLHLVAIAVFNYTHS